jgi:hypothetical protein
MAVLTNHICIARKFRQFLQDAKEKGGADAIYWYSIKLKLKKEWTGPEIRRHKYNRSTEERINQSGCEQQIPSVAETDRRRTDYRQLVE